ncbi:MAG: hypothetical protein ACLT33_00145 [Lachnospira pectinoschiza]
MERLLFAGNVALATTPATLAAVNATGIAEGAVALYDHEGAIISKALTKNIPMFTLFVGGGAFANKSKYANIVSNIDTRRFSYVKSAYTAGTKFSAEVTVPTPVVGKDYTLTMAKAHTVLNERYKWSASERAREGDTAAIIAKKLGDQLKSLGKNEGFTATVSVAKITVTGIDYEAWNLIAGDSMFGATITTTTKAMKPINDDAALKELQIRCIGAEGINSTSNDARKLYTLPEFSNADGWTVYTLTFYPHRDLRSGSTENVKTIIHLAIPTGAAQIATLDTILASINTPAAAAAAAGA